MTAPFGITKPYTLALTQAAAAADLLGAKLPPAVAKGRTETWDLARRAGIALTDWKAHAPSPRAALIAAVTADRDLADDPDWTTAVIAHAARQLTIDTDDWAEGQYQRIFLDHFDAIIARLDTAAEPITAELIAGTERFGDDESIFLDGRGLAGQTTEHIDAWARAAKATQVWAQLAQHVAQLYAFHPLIGALTDDERPLVYITGDGLDQLTALTPWKATAAGYQLHLADTTEIHRRRDTRAAAIEKRHQAAQRTRLAGF